MNYGFIKDGVITAPVAMCSVFNGIGAWHTLSDETRAEQGWYPCEVVKESVNALTASRSELPELAFDGKTITATYTVIAKGIETIRAELLQKLAEHRFSIEVSGLTLSNGLRVLTDRESQSQLTNAYVTLKNGLIADTDWKAANEWQLVDLEQIEPIAKAVAAHARGCFRGERVVQKLITEALDIKDLDAINIGQLFNTAYKEAFAEIMTTEQATA